MKKKESSKTTQESTSILVPDHKNFQRNLCPDFFGQQGAEDDGNLHQVVESERKAGRKKMGQIPKSFCGRVRVHILTVEEEKSV